VAAAFGFSRLGAARPGSPPVLLAATLALGAVAGRIDYTRPAGSLSVSLLQGNVPQEEKFAMPPRAPGAGLDRGAARERRGDLVIGPETVIPLLPDQARPGLVAGAARSLPPAGPRRPHRPAARQRASRATPTRRPASRRDRGLPGGFYRYDKHHLVPFGEFIPTGFRWFTELMNIPLGDFNRGRLNAPSFDRPGQRVAPNICYEDLFGEELAARFVPEEQAPTILANLSNIGWFGKTIAVASISRSRA
jgi:apolipoprotein N-acyltransferase